MKTLLILSALNILIFSNTQVFSQDKEHEENEAEESKAIFDTPFEEQFYKQRANSDGIVPYYFSQRKHSNENVASVSTGLTNFKFIGPYSIGARTRAFLVSRNNSNLLFAGGTTGGLWKSNDKGLSWAPLDDQALNLNVTCITQSRFNPDVIYYGTGEYVGNHTGIAGAGIFKSIDGGLTFSQLLSTNSASFEYCKSICHSITDSNTLYVGTDDSGLFRSMDGGLTFTQVYATNLRITDVDCFPNGKVWIGIEGSGVYESLSGNLGSFTKLNSTLPVNGLSAVQTAYCDSFPNTAYALFGDSLAGSNSGLLGLWKTTDGGINWTQTSNPDSLYDFYFPKLNLCLTVKPNNPQFVLCGASDLAYSANGGNTWHLVHTIHSDQHAIEFDPNDLTQFYNGNDEGIAGYSITQPALIHDTLNNGYDVAQYFAGYYFPNGISCLIGAQDNYTHLCQNADSVFLMLKVPGTVNGCFTAVNQQNPDITYLSGNSAKIFRCDNSLDSNATYYGVLNELDSNSDGNVDDDTWQVNPFEINPLDGNQLYFVTQQHIWRTVNGAANWTAITNTINSNKAPYCLGLSNDTFPTVYVGGRAGFFTRINNAYSATAGNETDLSYSIPASIDSDFISCLTVHPDSASIVYATFSKVNNEPRIWRITNANTATPVWTNISGNLPLGLSVHWIEVASKNPDSIFIAATAFGLYSSNDAGITWTKETAIPNVSILNMRLRKSDDKLFIFTHGRGAWTADIVPPVTSSVNSLTINDNEQLIISPNPNKGLFNIKAKLKSNGKATLIVADSEDHEVLRKNIALNAPELNIDLDLSKQASGSYILFIISGKNTIAKKFIIQ